MLEFIEGNLIIEYMGLFILAFLILFAWFKVIDLVVIRIAKIIKRKYAKISGR